MPSLALYYRLESFFLSLITKLFHAFMEYIPLTDIFSHKLLITNVEFNKIHVQGKSILDGYTKKEFLTSSMLLRDSCSNRNRNPIAAKF